LEIKLVAAIPPYFYLVSEPQILKFNPRCFAPKFRRNFTRRAENSDLLSKAAAGSRKTHAINFAPPLYGFVINIQHFIAAETIYFRHDEIHRPALPNRRRLNSASKRAFKILSGSRRIHGSRGVA
ncbi:hypothetical protein, partial [uncultured Campylobacter sp.]|uniref:hypothetical protein n=1 Tax=uncultured Campylobacter sp. TaxID=218934 RepID=UPI00261F6337